MGLKGNELWDVDQSKEVSVVKLLFSRLYSEALIELGSWPEGLARSWYEGSCFYHLKDFIAAEKIFRRLSLIPGFPVDVVLRLAISLQCQDRQEEALSTLLPAFACAEKFSRDARVKALILYGNICMEMGLANHFKQVISRFKGFVDLSSELRFLSGISELFIGDFESGWASYESRFALEWGRLPVLSAPLLCSASLSDCQHLVLFAESGQGIGDVLWALRCVPLLKQFVASISLVCPPSLVSLLNEVRLFDSVADSFGCLSAKATHYLPIMSAPFVLNSKHPVKMPSPCIRLGMPQDAFCLKDYLSGSRLDDSRRLVVALNWQGNQLKEGPMSAGIRGRSFDCSQFEGVTSLQECLLVSVQVGDSAQQIKSSWLSNFLHPAQQTLDLLDRDFLLTAQVLLQCDLLITNDTSVAHLGGLLNIPTWVVLKCFPYWQWGDHRQDNIWYPSIRCFRQQRPGDWESAMLNVNVALQSLLKA